MLKSKAVVFFAALAMSGIAAAGNSSGAITRLYVHSPNSTYGATNGVVMFSAGSIVGTPCSSQTEWAFSLSTETGKAMYAALLNAADKKRPVKVVGTGNCTAWSDRETPYYIYIDYP